MRFKKQKRHRKTVKFYVTCFGFREPFKVMCDGPFIHHLLVNNIRPADTAVSNVIGGKVKLFTTRCVIAELKRLGEAYSGSYQAAEDLVIARCDHEKRTSATTCIMNIIGEDNPKHFFVASQDTDLRKKFQEIPGVPVLFGLRNALLLEPPSTFQRNFVKSIEEKRLHMSESEYKMIDPKNKNSFAPSEEKDSADANEGLGEQKNNSFARKRSGVKDKVQFKRKRAKGPNPLSCKKKKTRDQVADKEVKDEGTKRSRSRKRKRSSKNEDVAAGAEVNSN